MAERTRGPVIRFGWIGFWLGEVGLLLRRDQLQTTAQPFSDSTSSPPARGGRAMVFRPVEGKNRALKMHVKWSFNALSGRHRFYGHHGHYGLMERWACIR